eukprot:4776164-Pleurochrysis_carterae.AAC.1
MDAGKEETRGGIKGLVEPLEAPDTLETGRGEVTREEEREGAQLRQGEAQSFRRSRDLAHS